MKRMNTERITIMVVDDHPLIREGIGSVVAGQSDMLLIAEATSGAEAIESYERHRPDITLMDVKMPTLNGIEATRAIRERFADARIIMLTTYEDALHAMQAIKAGAAGYMLKRLLRRDLLDTIRAVHRGQRCLPPSIATELAMHASRDDLSPREVTVLQLAAQGNSNKRIAASLGIAQETVKSHMRSLLQKLGANDRTHAVTIALNLGLIEP